MVIDSHANHTYYSSSIELLESDDDLFYSIKLKTLRNTAVGFLNTPGVAIPNGKDKNGCQQVY